MRGGRGGGDAGEDMPNHRAPRREFDDHHERDDRNFGEAPEIIEGRDENREMHRGGMRGMRGRGGRGRGGDFGESEMRSRDDFHVAPRNYYRGGDEFGERRGGGREPHRYNNYPRDSGYGGHRGGMNQDHGYDGGYGGGRGRGRGGFRDFGGQREFRE